MPNLADNLLRNGKVDGVALRTLDGFKRGRQAKAKRNCQGGIVAGLRVEDREVVGLGSVAQRKGHPAGCPSYQRRRYTPGHHDSSGTLRKSAGRIRS
jgi:hypothetical protein